MTVFYAMGSGWGHLYRTKMVATMFGKEDALILTTNTTAYTLFNPDQVVLITAEEMDANSCKGTLTNYLSDPAIDEIFIDTFPFGIMGELDTTLLEGKKINYLARRMKWDTYLKNISQNNISITLDTTYTLEPLEDQHQLFVEAKSSHTSLLKIEYPKPDYARVKIQGNKNCDPIWLIVHAFDKEEVEFLYNYACDCAVRENVAAYFIIISDQCIHLNTQGECIPHATAADWFPFADRIFTGGGFNTMQQVKPYLHKHTALPLPRKFDDQNWRINYFSKMVKQCC